MSVKAYRRHSVISVVIIFIFGPVWSGPDIQPADADPTKGAMLYQENCASCHGEELEGEPNWRTVKEDGSLPAPPHDETGHTWHHGDDLIFSYTKLGGKEALARSGITNFASGMPGFGEQLTDEEIWHVIAFLKSNWSERVQEIQAVRTEAEQLRGQ